MGVIQLIGSSCRRLIDNVGQTYPALTNCNWFRLSSVYGRRHTQRLHTVVKTQDPAVKKSDVDNSAWKYDNYAKCKHLSYLDTCLPLLSSFLPGTIIPSTRSSLPGIRNPQVDITWSIHRLFTGFQEPKVKKQSL